MEQLKTLIKGEIGRDIIRLETVDSTNTVAIGMGDKGAPHGTVVIADSQTKGRGRLGRTWISPSGANIYMSVILRPVLRPEDATLLTIMAAIACVNALRAATGVNVRIKWPNDLMVSDKKLGGILTEIKSDNDKVIFAVVGIGINVNSGPGDFPPEIRVTATSLKNETGKEQSKTSIIASVLNEMDRWYDTLANDGEKTILDEWRRLSSTIGNPVRVIAGSDTFTGIAEDIDEKGMLILRLRSGIFKKISAGDVTILR